MIRTGYSFRTAIGHLPEVAERLVELGWQSAPIADRQSTFGFARWTKLAQTLGLRPVYGVELAVTPSLGEKKPVLDYWWFLAQDTLRPLHELIYQATANPGREPSLTYAQAGRATGVFKITGERTLIKHVVLDECTYLGLSPATPKGLAREALAAGLRPVAVSANYYPRAKDKELYRVALGKRAFTQTYPMYILGDDEWLAATNYVADTGTQSSALANRATILEACRATLPKAKLLVPDKPAPLRVMCEQGAERLKVNLEDPVYFQRLERELDLIREKNFEDYFYIIADMVQWAKKRMIMGPARGSSCGSLVCYLLGITSVDPIPFGLLFERFIDINRSDLPDIDLDFSDVRRHLVFEYAERKYGADRVARLGTVGMFKPKSALNQAAISLRIPRWKVEKTLDGQIQRSSGDARAMMQLEDTLKETPGGRALLDEHPEALIAIRMEGHPHIAGQHAAGIIITQEPVIDYVAVDARTKSIYCDKKDAEAYNLLKIDALGLTQLSIFERTLQLIGKPDVAGWLEALPFDDQAAYDVLNRKHYAGIFQFTGQALQSIAKQVHFSHITDIVALTAIARPGPLATGGANNWVKRKNGQEEITTLHPMLTELTRDTYGITIYQEQVMTIVREMGRLSWKDTSAIRKAMSGSLGDEFFAQYWEKFKAGAMENGIDPVQAQAIWDQICTFGSWSFNKSHAVAYGIMSYWCCWLKAHHPLEFAAATLDAETEPFKQLMLLRELEAEGIKYVPVDPDRSTDRWTIHDGVLIGPLTNIKGLGPASVAEILDARRGGTPVRAALSKRLNRAITDIDSLYPIADKIKRLHPDLTKINIFSEPTKIQYVQTGYLGEVMVMGCITKIAPRDVNETVNLKKRNGKWLHGPRWQLNMFIRDDTDEMYCCIDRFNFERMAQPIIERGRPGKALYAVKGTVPSTFRMMKVKAVRFLGFIDDEDPVHDEQGTLVDA